MIGFREQDGTYHDDNRLVSQNVFTYGMYAKLLGLDVSQYPAFWEGCKKRIDKDEISFTRLPGLKNPPPSPEEALGAHVLGLIDYDSLKGNHFVFIGRGSPLTPSSIITNLLKGLIELNTPRITVKGWTVKVHKASWKDRNAWWKHNMESVKYFAARMHPGLTYCVKKYNGRDFHVEEEKLYVFWRDCTMKSDNDSTNNKSQKMLLWACLVLIGDHRRAKKLKPIEVFESYFGPDHVLTHGMKIYYQNR